jgi:amidase
MRLTTFGDDALGTHDTTALVEELRSGRVSPTEVMDAARNRLKEADALNAVVTLLDTPDDLDGPYAGIPTFIKDNEDISGYPTRFGSRTTPEKPASHDSRWVRQWRELGFSTMGKTTLPEFGLTASTECLLTGATRNPWHLDHIAGGSSGGSAALVAAGVVPIAHANDGGGSIRIPASCCGLVGLKPTRGRLIDVEAMDQMPVKIVTQGVLTRTVRDTVGFYEQMARIQPTDLPTIGATADPAPLRIGLMATGVNGLPIDPEVQAALEATGLALEGLGHTVEPIVNPFGDQIAQDFLRYWAMLAFSLYRFGGQVFGKDFEPKRMEPFGRSLGKFFSGVAVNIPASLRRLRRFPQVYDDAFGPFHVLLSPTLSTPPPRIGYLGPDVDPHEHLVRLLRFASFTALQNVSGAPAISLPLAVSASGLPIGMQFAARAGEEQLLLNVAASLEDSVGWGSQTAPGVTGSA